MPEKLFGIPSHPLMVHIPVVLLPLCALLAILLVVRPFWVRHYGWPFLVLSFVSMVGTVVAAASGEGLKHILNERNPAVDRHAEWGDRTRLAAIVFFVLAAAFVYLVKRFEGLKVSGTPGSTTVVNRSAAVLLVAALLVISAVASTGAVMYTGHTGAKSAWGDAGK